MKNNSVNIRIRESIRCTSLENTMFLVIYFFKILSLFGERILKKYDSEKSYIYWVFGIHSPYEFTDLDK